MITELYRIFKKKKTIENPKLHFLTIICVIRKNVRIQSCSFQKDLQVLSHTVYEKTHIFCFNSKKYDLNSRIPFFRQNI